MKDFLWPGFLGFCIVALVVALVASYMKTGEECRERGGEIIIDRFNVPHCAMTR